MNLELYRTFYEVSRSGSITKAAEMLHITQPTVSYAVKQLEHQLGVKLFHRKSKGVTLTKEGDMLFRYVKDAIQLLDIGKRKIEDMKNLHAGEVRIGISETLCKYYLLPALEFFHEKFPDIRLRLIHGNSPRIAKHLHEGNIDFGIVQLPVDDERIEVLEMFTMQDCFVTGDKYKYLSEGKQTLGQLLHYPLITLSEQSNTKRFLVSLIESHGLKVHPEIELGNIELLKDFTSRGFGITFIVEAFVSAELQSGTLHKIAIEENIPVRKAGMITMKDTPLSIAANQLLNQLDRM